MSAHEDLPYFTRVHDEHAMGDAGAKVSEAVPPALPVQGAVDEGMGLPRYTLVYRRSTTGGARQPRPVAPPPCLLRLLLLLVCGILVMKETSPPQDVDQQGTLTTPGRLPA